MRNFRYGFLNASPGRNFDSCSVGSMLGDSKCSIRLFASHPFLACSIRGKRRRSNEASVPEATRACPGNQGLQSPRIIGTPAAWLSQGS